MSIIIEMPIIIEILVILALIKHLGLSGSIVIWIWIIYAISKLIGCIFDGELAYKEEEDGVPESIYQNLSQ